MFGQKTKQILGVDVSDSSVKLVQLEAGQKKLSISAYSEIPINPQGAKQAVPGQSAPTPVQAGQDSLNPAQAVDAIRHALAVPKMGKITTNHAIASIPETKSFVRVIQMPKMGQEEAKEAIPFEAEAYIPMPVGQVYLDWLILPGRIAGAASGQTEGAGAAGDDQEKMTVLIVASPKDYVDSFTSVLKGAGLRPQALEVESQATARSLVQAGKGCTMIMDINTVRSSMIIVEDGILQFTSSIPIAGRMFTESIARKLGVPVAKAEKIKLKYGIDQNAERGQIYKALTPVVNNLVSEIKNTIRFFEEHNQGAPKIDKLLLTGGSSKLKHLPSYLYSQLLRQDQIEHTIRSIPGIKVELGNPWVKILGKRQSPPMSREESLGYATAIGLALREVEE